MKINRIFRILCLFGIISVATGSLFSGQVSAQQASSTVADLAPAAGNNIYLPLVANSASNDNPWSMAGANPQRTSWTPEEVRGPLKPLWYKQFEPYINPKFQIIAAYNTLYISTASGLYALDADTGAEKWVYPTEMPLGQSPTIYQSVAYVGGFDKKIHAINALNGQGLWEFEAEAGFDTSPLVVNGIVYAGSRDGYFYAVYASGPKAGQLAWKYKTGGPIDYSAAYQDGVIFFASNDSYAYALDAQTGELTWKSTKLPGAGFYSWWPVVYKDWVIFAGSNNYRLSNPGTNDVLITSMELMDIYPNYQSDPSGTLVGPLNTEPGEWANGTPTIDTSKPDITSNGSTLPITEYFEEKPWRRTYFVLNRATGKEYTTDFDGDGKPEYAPILWQGTHSGNRYPPVVGSDGVLYQANNYMSNPYIAGTQVTGWQIGTPFISIVSSNWNAVDEPYAYSAGGNLIYWNLLGDRESGAFDIRIPNTDFKSRYDAGIRPPTGGFASNREWRYFAYNLNDLIPGYSSQYYDPGGWGTFGGREGVYGDCGDQNPPIPYMGKIYMHRSNTVIAFAPKANQPIKLSMANTISVQNTNIPYPNSGQLKLKLANEVGNILSAGHLRPGYYSSGIFDFQAYRQCGDRLIDYWHNPGDLQTTLIRALPYLPTDLQDKTKAYLKAEFAAYPLYQYNHIGWKDGSAREVFDLPPEVSADLVNYPPQNTIYGFDGWSFNPLAFYAMWKYSEVFGNAQAIYEAGKDKLESVPSDAFLLENPQVHNAYIAGYWGYLELEKLAGYPESSDIQQKLTYLLDLRAKNFSIDVPDMFFSDKQLRYCRSLNISRNFIYLVPELAQYLHDHAFNQVQQALNDYYRVAPYWFVSRFDVTFGEGVMEHLYDYHALFQAKAQILQEPYDELAKYLDVPAAKVGDLFYIDNLVAALEAESRANP